MVTDPWRLRIAVGWLGLCLAGGIPLEAWAGSENLEGNRLSEVFTRMRHEMVETQIRARGIVDDQVLRAMRHVPRHEFVPALGKLLAYSDAPLSIGHGQTISQPYIVALMTELLKLQPTDKVFEVGTGSGYQAAVLGEMATEVYTIEILEPLYEEAKARLAKLGYSNVHVLLGDGTKGWPEAAPFDKIIVTAAGLKIPNTLIDQLKEGGRLVMPVGEFEQTLIVGEKKKGLLHTTETIPVRFVPLIEE